MTESNYNRNLVLWTVLEQLEEAASRLRNDLTNAGVECSSPPLPYILATDITAEQKALSPAIEETREKAEE